jgi:hypothetical protein
MSSTPPERRPNKLSQAIAQEFSLQATIGGPRGVLESVLPYTVFSVVYGTTKDLKASIIASVVPLVVFAIWRIVTREPLTQALSGAVGIALGAYLAHRTGHAKAFFLPSIWKNTGFALLYAASMVVRWPLIGVIIGPLTGEMWHWRKVPARAMVYQLATGFWLAMFLIRLAVQIPLYLANQVTLLGTLNGLVLGFPLFALCVYLCWLVLRRVPLAKPPEGDRSDFFGGLTSRE